MKSISFFISALMVAATANAAGKFVSYEVDGAPYEGYYAPSAAGAPMVLLIHDWDGLTDYEVQRSEMLAKMRALPLRYLAATVTGKMRTGNPGGVLRNSWPIRQGVRNSRILVYGCGQIGYIACHKPRREGMRVYFHPDCYAVYTYDPAAAAGRLEAVVQAIDPYVEFCTFSPAAEIDLLDVHSERHIARIRDEGLYDIAALAAGGAIHAAEQSLEEPAFALIRPPGHHASADSCWGFCYFNNMAVSLCRLHRGGRIQSAFILDFDMHFGDGTVNILGRQDWVDILNPHAFDRRAYLDQVKRALDATRADVIAVSAGFDNHVQDWGNVLATDDYRTMGAWVRQAANRNNGGCYGILEGGYNHDVLGENVMAFLEGMMGDV